MPPIKVNCERCGKFAGFLGDDGTGPLHEECLEENPDPKCPMIAICEMYLPPCRPTSPGNHHNGGTDRHDWGSMYSHAQHVEDRR